MKKLKDKIIIVLLGGFMFGMTILGIILPDMEYSVSERRELESFPEITVKNILSGKFMADFEDYASDHFPLRDMFRKIKAGADKMLEKQDVNGIYEHDGYLAKMDHPIDYDSIENAAEKFGKIYESYLGKSEGKIYLSVIPDKNCFLAQPSGHLSYDVSLLAGSLAEKMPYAEYIDILPLLSAEDYYLTDTHWKQENIIGIADTIKKAMGAETSSEYVAVTNDIPFYGVYASQYALNESHDNISRVESDIISSLKVYDHENMKEIPVYDEGKITSDDPYELFLGGPVSLITIENPSVHNGKTLTVFRDSFTSSLAPLLAEGYEKVTLIDIRYIAPNVLSNFVEFDGGDVLFIYSSMVINSSETLK